MIDIDTIYTTLDSAFSSDNVLDILMEFERTLDNLDIYVFKNWIKGEIVEGPQIDRYWITVSLMYPYKMARRCRSGRRWRAHAPRPTGRALPKRRRH